MVYIGHDDVYSAEIKVTHMLGHCIYGVHKIEGAASAAEAYNAAWELSGNVETLYPWYVNVDVTVFRDGILVDENEYAECWRIGD